MALFDRMVPSEVSGASLVSVFQPEYTKLNNRLGKNLIYF